MLSPFRSLRQLIRSWFTWRKQGTIRRKPASTRLATETLEDRLAPATFAVINTNDSGAGSLRQAIMDANASAGADVIAFNTAYAYGPGCIRSS
jgi:hypothetical protein